MKEAGSRSKLAGVRFLEELEAEAIVKIYCASGSSKLAIDYHKF